MITPENQAMENEGGWPIFLENKNLNKIRYFIDILYLNIVVSWTNSPRQGEVLFWLIIE